MSDENVETQEAPSDDVNVEGAPPADGVAQTETQAAEPKESAQEPDGGSSDDTVLDAASTWPEDWRQRFAGSDEKLLKRLNRFTSPENVWKSYRSLEQKLNSGEYKRNMPDGANEEALAKWRAEVGVPETPEGYYSDLPEGLNITDEDKAVLDRVMAKAHEKGTTSSEIGAIVEEYYTAQAEEAAARLEKDAERRIETEDELHMEWGPEYRINMNAINVWASNPENAGIVDMLVAARDSDGNRLGDNPDLMKWLAQKARTEMTDGEIYVPSQPGLTRLQSVQSEIRELESMMQNTRGEYWSGPKSAEYQRRYGELLQAEERMRNR